MGRKPEPWPDILRDLEKMRETIDRLVHRSPFFGTGMHTNGQGGMDSDTYVHGVSGFSLKGSTGNIEVNDITLRGGIIGNDALTNPVVPGSVWVEASDFVVSPAWSTVINHNLTVPLGVTSAEIDARARVTAFYNNAGDGTGVDYLYAILYVGDNDSDFYPLAVTDSGGSGTNQVFRSAVLTGLTPGADVNFQVQVSTDNATWIEPAAPGNKAKLGASIRWYR